MALIDLLKNENTFIFGVGGSIDNIKTINLAYGGPSKSIRYGANTGGRRGEKDVPNFHLFPRVLGLVMILVEKIVLFLIQTLHLNLEEIIAQLLLMEVVLEEG